MQNDHYTNVADLYRLIDASKRARQAQTLIQGARVELDRMLAANRAEGEPPYSLRRVVLALLDNDLERQAPREYEASCRLAEAHGRQPQPGNVFVPIQRDLTAGVASAGGYLVANETAPGGLFVGAMEAASVATALNVTVLPMRGNAVIPRTTVNVTSYHLGTEGTSITEGEMTFGAIAATPKTVGAKVDVSRLLKPAGGAAVEAFLLSELGRSVGANRDRAMIAGSGAAGEPTGIINTSGIGSVSGTSLANAGVVDLVHAVRNSNATSVAFVAAPNVEQLLSKRERATGSGMLWDSDRLSNRPAFASNSMPASTLLCGDWANVVLFDWGALEVGVNPYGADPAAFRAGITEMRALWTYDVAVLRPASFAVSASIT